MACRIVGVLAVCWAAVAPAAEPPGLHQALEQLSRRGEFSGAVVISGRNGVHFARGYGQADPFASRPFTPDTPVDSGSLAKPATAAAVLMLVKDGRVQLDAPVVRYLPDYPHAQTTVRHLLSHSAGLAGYGDVEPLDGKTNEDMLLEIRRKNLLPQFEPGSRFSYCNTCYNTLALLVERVSRQPYLSFLKSRLMLPPSVTVRPKALSDWLGRAVGFRTSQSGSYERADSYEDEAFYGSANLSISAKELSRWGTEWWRPELASVRHLATSPATVAGKATGLTLGNWYCDAARSRCHYLGHHEGFHHMLYWNAKRRISLAMVSNNSLPAALQQRLQRALVAWAEGDSRGAANEIRRRLPRLAAKPGSYRSRGGEQFDITAGEEPLLNIAYRGVSYLAYPLDSGIKYVPGLDAYLSATPEGQLRFLTLYEDFPAAAERTKR